MGLCENLTQAQATLAAGIAVLLAGALAFSTGWFERRATLRRLHYEELKALYVDIIAIGNRIGADTLLNKTRGMYEIDDSFRDRMNKLSAELWIVCDRKSARVLGRYLTELAEDPTSAPNRSSFLKRSIRFAQT